MSNSPTLRAAAFWVLLVAAATGTAWWMYAQHQVERQKCIDLSGIDYLLASGSASCLDAEGKQIKLP